MSVLTYEQNSISCAETQAIFWQVKLEQIDKFLCRNLGVGMILKTTNLSSRIRCDIE